MNALAKEIQPTELAPDLAELVTRAEYDIQIATAQKYPRSVKQFLNNAREMVTLNESVASGCIYALPRDGKNIEGPSARFAEIMLHAWGHCRAGARIVHEDGRFITAQGVCHDLQRNTLIAFEVRRRITGKSGARYSDDMIGVTGNAASSIALRNAILKVIPKAFWEPLYIEARKVVAGDSTTMANRRANALVELQKFGATKEMIMAKLGVKGVEDITVDHLVTLGGLMNAMRDGEVTVEEAFRAADEKAEQKGAAQIKEKLKARGKAQAAPHDPETGEVLAAEQEVGSQNGQKDEPSEAEENQPPAHETQEAAHEATQTAHNPAPTAPKPAQPAQVGAGDWRSVMASAIHTMPRRTVSQRELVAKEIIKGINMGIPGQQLLDLVGGESFLQILGRDGKGALAEELRNAKPQVAA